jgi:hypothetical protein
MQSSSSSRRGRSRTNSTTSPELLWVNRTPESETLSTTRQEREELRTITSHARQWRAALRRQQRLYSAQTEATRAQRVVGWGRPGALSETSSAETSAAPSPPALALATSTTGTMADQFAYLETPNDGWWSHNAFQYSVQVWLPDIFHDLDLIDETWPSSSNSSHSVPVAISRIVQGCLANRMHMYALLAASSGFKKFVLRQQLDRHDAPEYCMGKALQHLRHYLSGSTHPAPRVDELLIFDLMALSIFELYVDNPEGARTHFNMVHHLEQMLGGAENLEPALRALCRSWDPGRWCKRRTTARRSNVGSGVATLCADERGDFAGVGQARDCTQWGRPDTAYPACRDGAQRIENSRDRRCSVVSGHAALSVAESRAEPN